MKRAQKKFESDRRKFFFFASETLRCERKQKITNKVRDLIIENEVLINKFRNHAWTTWLYTTAANSQTLL